MDKPSWAANPAQFPAPFGHSGFSTAAQERLGPSADPAAGGRHLAGAGHKRSGANAAYPPENYKPLLFDPAETTHVFRLDGAPWICRGDTFCKPVKIDGVADKDLKQATIEPLGYAGRRYFLSYSHASLNKGRPIALSCEDTRCEKLDATIGATASLGVFQVKDGDRMLTRTALLRQVDERKGRAQLLWCSDSDCSEMPLTRDSEKYLAYMGTGFNGRPKHRLAARSVGRRRFLRPG